MMVFVVCALAPISALRHAPREKVNFDFGWRHRLAMDARSYNFKTHLVKECNGDCSAVAHAFSLHDIASRLADIASLAKAVMYLSGVDPGSRGATRLIDAQGNKQSYGLRW